MNIEATWTTERVQQLQSCLTAGLTCSQIAAEIGVTRNAVIGKINRLGMSSGKRPAALAKRMQSARGGGGPTTRMVRLLRAMHAQMSAVAPSDTGVGAAPVESAQRCSLLELAGGRCRFPLGDPAKPDFAFCGNDAVAGFSYCAGHARIAYRLPSGRRA
jgi:GcrA cell cycle regulator